MQYYIIDTTVKPAQEKRFNSYHEIVHHLEHMCIRAYGQNRKQRMLLLEECGHGTDDSRSVTFVRAMAENFNMGVLRDGLNPNQKMRCDITAVANFQQDEFGS